VRGTIDTTDELKAKAGNATGAPGQRWQAPDAGLAQGSPQGPPLGNHRGGVIRLAVAPSRIATWLGAVMVVIVALHGAGQSVRFLTGYNSVFGLVQLLSLYEESNLPTWYSSTLLLLGALLLAVAGQAARLAGERWGAHWLGLTGIFLFLSIDESAMLHEKIGAIFKSAIGDPSLRSAWIYPFAGIVGVLGIVYARFLLALPALTRNLFVLSGLIFVGGAIGVELIEAKHVFVTRADDIFFSVLVAIEETMEMGGMILFIYALLRHLRTRSDGILVAWKR
jgi:hypothetical protein